MPFLALLTGPLGRIGLAAVAAIGVLAGVALWFREHDARIRAEDAARVAAATAAAQIHDAQAGAAAVTADAAAAIARAQSATAIKLEIAHAPPSLACVASAPVRAALDGLRRPAAGAGAGAPGAAPLAAGLPGAARPAQPPH